MLDGAQAQGLFAAWLHGYRPLEIAGRNFDVSRREPGAFDVTKLGPILAELHERLAGVVIENLPFGEFITRYDAPETLFYLDPPYFGSETDYGVPVGHHRLSSKSHSGPRGAAISAARRPRISRLSRVHALRPVAMSDMVDEVTQFRARGAGVGLRLQALRPARMGAVVLGAAQP